MDECRSSAMKALGLALLLTAFSACSDKPEDSTKALAIINGKEITASEFDLRWSQLPEFARKTYAGPDGRKKFLEELITRELLLQEARKRGLDRDRALIERVERFKERSVLDHLMREEVDSRITVTLEEMKAYYAANPGSFTSQDDMRASHILVKTEEDALDVKKRLEQGEEFAALAKKASLDLATKFKGGDLGPIKKGQTIPQFEKTLLALKVGETSHPVATQFGYHIIKLNDRTTGAPLSFEDAKDQVKEQIQVEKKRKRFDELVASLRAKAKLRVADVPIPISEVPAAGTP
ncbi:MAG: peptidylprolyl isomerase [Nitrospirota bacterium]